MSRLISNTLGIRKGLLSQRDSSGQMEHFRHSSQEMSPVIDHVRFNTQKVNGAPKRGNKNDWRFIGSIPMTILLDWLQENNVTIDAFARNDDGIKDKFKDWFLKSRDMSKFIARSHNA